MIEDDAFAEQAQWQPPPNLPDFFELNDDQTRAVQAVDDWLKLPKHERMWLTLTGAAGTGKTVCLRRIAPLLPSPLFAGMTGKAATRMREAAGVPAATLHKLLYAPPTVDEEDGTIKFNEIRQPPYGATLVIDEASMVTPHVAQHLRRWTNEFAVRILFVGDGFQLPPVVSREEIKNGAPEDYSIFGEVPGPALSKVMRNGDAILDAATMLRTKSKLPTTSRGGYRFEVVPDAIDRAISDYLADPHDHGLITWTNRTRMTTNQIIRSRLGIRTEMPQPGEPVLVCKNGGRVLNGEVYRVQGIRMGEMVGPVPTYWIDTVEGPHIFAHGWSWTGEPPYIQDRDEWKQYRREIERRTRSWGWDDDRDPDDIPEPIPVTYGYALSCHKAQGSEYRRVTTFLPAMDAGSSHFRKLTELPDGTKIPFGIRWYYTATTRAKEQLTVLVGKS